MGNDMFTTTQRFLSVRPAGLKRAGIAAIALSFATLPGTVSADDAALFDTPEAAVNALLQATQSGEKGALAKIFGSSASELLSGDDVQDKADLQHFAHRIGEARRLAPNPDNSMTLYVGRNDYPFPIPIAPKSGKWYFDTDAGKEEILNRRIGENELNTIGVCRAIFVAQREYAASDRDGDDVLEYAQRIASTPGMKDGLFWNSTENESPSPMGPLVAQAWAEGYSVGKAATSSPHPYHGYFFRILTKQGPNAPGGKFDFVINGNMVAGHAVVAYPASYGQSGIMTFLVGTNGRILQEDLGDSTEETGAAMAEFNPDESWSLVKD